MGKHQISHPIEGSNAVMRRFRLIEELEYSEKKGGANISFGPDNPEDKTLTKWNGSIFGPEQVDSAKPRVSSRTGSTLLS